MGFIHQLITGGPHIAVISMAQHDPQKGGFIKPNFQLVVEAVIGKIQPFMKRQAHTSHMLIMFFSSRQLHMVHFPVSGPFE